jgi:hypothetical protein
VNLIFTVQVAEDTRETWEVPVDQIVLLLGGANGMSVTLVDGTSKDVLETPADADLQCQALGVTMPPTEFIG